jgi:drug/metabolite transporter (DMT)-like permease
LRLGLVADLVRQPIWLASLVATGVGFGLQLLALATGPVAMVQPLLVSGLLFAVLFRSFLAGRPPRKFALVGAGLCAVGLAAFLAVARPPAGSGWVTLLQALPLAIGLAVVLAGCLAVAAWRPGEPRALAFALGGGVLYGLTAGVAKIATGVFAGGGFEGLFRSWPLYAMAVLGPSGFLLNQHAYRSHPVMAPAQALITIVDPLVSVALGMLWLHERLQGGAAAIAGEVLALAAMVGGVWLLAHHAPQVARETSRSGQLTAQQGSPP